MQQELANSWSFVWLNPLLLLPLLLQDFSKRMYELIKEKIGVTADLPSSSSSNDDEAPAKAPAAARDADDEDTDKSEL